MKYSDIVCAGHPRSGTHYITALISINFLDDVDYLKVYRNHELPQIVRDPDVGYIHIWRDFEGVAKSIYVLRERFGLDVADYEEFIATPYRDMWMARKSHSVVTNVRTLTGSARYPGAVDFFKEVDMTPRDYWEFYNRSWIEWRDKNSNIISVKYEDVLEDFGGTMAYVAEMLHCDVGHFKNIDRRVGWWK
jgi:hypothetical protein